METLKKKYEFRRLYTKGKSAVTPLMVVYCRPNAAERSRIGYTVSNKLGHAVTRNRIRRRIREIYRLNLPRLEGGYDLVVVARSRSAEAEYAQLERSFLSACDKLSLVRKEMK
ncbi:MAG: ribonuclease P protein component [Oscillospiraceae bacterium]|nr:ribonuclease P protein component [Oscillospiraceae bacterium]